MDGRIRLIQLSETQRAALEKSFKTGKRAVFRQRCHFVLLSDQGYGVKEIAQVYQTTRQLVGRWLDRYEAAGIEGLHTRKGRGEKPILRVDNTEQVERVKALVAEHAQDLKPVLTTLEEELGRSLSKRTLQRFLKSLTTPGNASAP
jgi:transposase